LRCFEQPNELLWAPAHAYKKIGHVAALADFRRQLNNSGVGNQPRDSLGPGPTCGVVVKAHIYSGDFAERIGPLGPERCGATGRRDRCKAPTLQDQLVKLSFADDDLLGFGEHSLPIVELGARTGGREHLGAVRSILGVFRELEKGQLTLPVENRDRDPAAVPAQKEAVYHGVRNPALLPQVVAEALGQVAMVFLSKWQALNHGFRLAMAQEEERRAELSGQLRRREQRNRDYPLNHTKCLRKRSRGTTGL